MGRLARVCAGLIAAAVLAGCAVSEANRIRDREVLTRRIVDDAMAYNEAYNSAITGQILLNVMRAYNRQPRQYTSMSGFTNGDSVDSRNTTFGISDLPLGELGEQWGAGAFQVERGAFLEPQYNVEPFSTEDFSNIALRPTSRSVFKYYWESGWNRDLLLILLVDEMRISGTETTTLFNSAGTIAMNCAGADDPVRPNGCTFVRRARALADETRSVRVTAPPAALEPENNGPCYPVASYNVASARRILAAPAAGQTAPQCPVVIDIGRTQYTLQLRSLDDVVYYVGELLRVDRSDPNVAPAGELRARLNVVAPGSLTEGAPIFRVVSASAETEREYAATVTYGGRRFSAGAPSSYFCYDPRGPQYCTGASQGDRSGSVLELLVGILAHNQSEAAVRAPQPVATQRE